MTQLSGYKAVRTGINKDTVSAWSLKYNNLIDYIDSPTAYWVDYSATDQGVVTVATDRSVKDLVDAIGATQQATIIFKNNSASDTTTYTFSTNETIPSNIYLVLEPGAIISVASGYTLTVYSPEHILCSPRQQIFAGLGTVAFTVPGTVYPGWWGVVGDGTDEYTGLAQVITSCGQYGTIFFPQPSVVYGSATGLVQLSGQRWVGEGGQRATIIRKLGNVDLITMGTLGELRDLAIDGNGATYTGVCVAISSGVSQVIDRCRIYDSAGIGIYYTHDAGDGSIITRTEVTTTSPNTVAAIASDGTFETTACPRFLDNLWLSGGFIDFSGWNGSFLSNSYLRRFVTSEYTNQLQVTNCRIANLTDTMTLYGNNNSFSNSAVAGTITLGDGCQGWQLTRIAGVTDITQNATGVTYCAFDKQMKEYTPTWDQASGDQPAIGNGTIEAWYVRHGYLCTVNIKLVGGDTTVWGNGATYWRFSIPYPAAAGFDQDIPYAARGRDSTGPADYPGTVHIPDGYSWFSMVYTGATFRSDGPFTWADTDILEVNFTYIVV